MIFTTFDTDQRRRRRKRLVRHANQSSRLPHCIVVLFVRVKQIITSVKKEEGIIVVSGCSWITVAATVPAGPLYFIQKIKRRMLFFTTHTHIHTLIYIILYNIYFRILHFDNTVISGTNRSPRRQMLPTRNAIKSCNIL